MSAGTESRSESGSGPQAADDGPASFLAAVMRGEMTFQTGSPSASYFWYRKRRQVRRLVLANLRRFPKGSPGAPARFVDLGCGDGLELFLLKQLLDTHSPHYRYTGIDGDAPRLAAGERRKEFAGSPAGVDFRLADFAAALPLEDHSVDLLYCSEVIEHMPEPERFLAELRRVVKPGGHLILTTPNEPNCFQKSYWLRGGRSRFRVAQEHARQNPMRAEVGGREVLLYGHVSCRTARQWDRALAAAGFALVDYRRGAVVYGGSEFHDRPFVLGWRLMLEGTLDLLPRWLTRSLSDEVIALYRAG